MLIVIDESGCPGFKASSSTHYVLGMVIFEDFKDAENTARIIKNLMSRISARREFHFSHCNDKKRYAFFDAIKDCKFSIRIFVAEKRLIRSKELKSNNAKFVKYCLKTFLGSDYNSLENAIVKIDGQGSKIFKKSFSSYVKREVSKEKIAKIKFVDSEKDVLVQLADMIVSGYSRPYNNPNKKDANKYRDMISSKIESVWNFK